MYSAVVYTSPTAVIHPPDPGNLQAYVLKQPPRLSMGKSRRSTLSSMASIWLLIVAQFKVPSFYILLNHGKIAPLHKIV